MQLSPGLHRIGNDLIAVHLVVTDEGITLIDAGLAGHYSDLRRELTAIGRPLSDIRGIVLTHGDTDHTGFAERLRKELGIPVYVGAADAARAQGEKPPATPTEKRRLGPMLRFFAYAIGKGGFRMPAVEEVVPVEDGDVLPLPGAPVIDDQAGSSASLDRIASLDVDWVIPGHGAPWHGDAPSLIAAYREAERRR